MVARCEIYWAALVAPFGRRPVCVLTRDAAIPVLSMVTCAPVTRTVRGIRSEVEIGTDEGLSGESVISCDNLVTVPMAALSGDPVGRLGPAKRAALDGALRYALDIRF